MTRDNLRHLPAPAQVAYDAYEAAKLTIELQNSIMFEGMKKHLEKTIGALAELLEREENRDVDTVEEFLEAVKFMNENGMKYKAVQLQIWLDDKESAL